MLTPRQLECLAFIDGYLRDTGGVSPSFDEIGAHLGLKAKSAVNGLVNRLVERGHLHRMRRRPRALEVIASGPVARALGNLEKQRKLDEAYFEIRTAEQVYATRRNCRP